MNRSFATGIWFSVVTGLCWAFLAIELKYALHFASAGTIVWFRMVFATAMLLIYFTIRNPKSIKKVFWPPPPAMIISALFLSVDYYGYMKGIELTSANNAQIMIQTGPILLLLIGVYYFRESMRAIQWFGVAVAAFGFLLFDWDQTLLAFKDPHAYLLGNVWVVVGGVAWAIYAALQKAQYAKNWSPQETNLLINAVCVIAMLPFVTFSEVNFASPSVAHSWGALEWVILFTLGLNTVVAYGSFAEAMQIIPSSYVSLIITVNPLLTILLMTIIASYGFTFVTAEPIEWRGYLGAALVVVGVAIAVSLRKKTAAKIKK